MKVSYYRILPVRTERFNRKSEKFMLKYISLLLIAGLAISCKKEAAPTPSDQGTNPYARVDNASSPVDHAIYELYQSTGVPVFYTDTIATDPLLKFTYNLQLDPAAYLQINYLTDQQDILNGVSLLKEGILPYLTDSLMPFSIMLTDSIISTSSNHVVQALKTFQALNGLVISNVSQIRNMPPDTLAAYRAAILKDILFTPVMRSAGIDSFYAVSNAYYNKNVYGDGSITGYLAYKPKEEYGFLEVNYESSVYYQAPAQADDLDAYLGAVLSVPANDFTTTYNSYPLVMKKYNKLVAIVKAIGFKL
jgi:hypothetical protein